MQAFVVRCLPWQPRRLLPVGLAICLLGIVVSLAERARAGLIGAVGAIGAGHGLAQSGLAAAVSIVGGKHRQGQVAGVVQAAMAAAWIAGARGGTALYPLSIAAPLLVAAAAMAFALCLAYAGVPPAAAQTRR